MPLQDFVASSLAIANASSPTVQSLNTGLVAGYHNFWTARVQVYSTSSALASLVAAGMPTYHPIYKAVQRYASAASAPSLVAIGKRNLPFTQVLRLTCTDGTVGDTYNLTVIGSTGVSTALAYTNVINVGSQTVLSGTVSVTNASTSITFSTNQTLAADTELVFASQPGVIYVLSAAVTAGTTGTLTAAYSGTTNTATTTTATVGLSGTVSVTNGSTALTFTASQTLSKGALLVFSSQPGVYYALSAAISASTSGTLTTAYSGTTTAAAASTTLAPLSGTFDAINGSAIVATTASQVGAVAVGDSVQFVSQLGTYYTVSAVSSSAITLTTPYTGTTAATTNASDVCQVTTAATALQSQMTAITNIGSTSVSGAVITMTQVPGALTDIVGWLQNGFSNIQIQDVTADPGIATDLAAMVAANSAAFYAVMLDSNSQAEVQAASTYCQATGTGGKVLFANNSDYQNTQSTVTTDVFSVLANQAVTRAFIQHNSQELISYGGAAACGYALAQNPGSYTLAYKTLPLVTADSDTTLPETQALTLNTMTASNPGPGGKKGNYYKSVAGQLWLWPGCAPSGQFFDLTIGLDWLALAIQQAVAAVLSGLPKVPFTAFGLQLIGQAINNTLVLASSPTYALIVPNGADSMRPITVNVPSVSSLTSATRATRSVSGFTWSAGLQGAIQTAVINGTLLP